MNKLSNNSKITHSDLIDIIEHANDLVQSVAPDGSFIYVNKTWKKTLGYSDEEISRLKFFDIIADTCKDSCSALFSQVLKGRSLENVETTFKAKDGRLIYVEGSCNCRFENGKPISTRGIFRDITDRKKSEAEKLQLQKRLEKAKLFESLGIMAGGIAHDYNNILMGILGFTELIKMKAASKEDVLRLIDQVEKSALRAAALTQQILAFSGASNISLETKNLTSLIEEIKPYISTTVPSNINVTYDLTASLPIDIDSTQITQAITDVIQNSIEAIGEEYGNIIIKTGYTSLEEKSPDDIFIIERPKPGVYSFIEIVDDGPGISERDIHKVFEPFYTTKFQGRGLGLSATLGIVRGHGGLISLKSAAGKGTCIRMFFPVHEKDSKQIKPNTNILVNKDKIGENITKAI